MPKSFTLLLVDDDLDFLSALRNVLKDTQGVRLLTASTAESASQLLPQADAVLADCVFPYATEFESIVRKSGKPLARMSGKVDRALNLELKKPFSRKQLLETVQLLRFLHTPRLKESFAA